MPPSNIPNRAESSMPEISASRDLNVYQIEDCGATIRLHWIASDNGEKGYTEMSREVALERGVAIPSSGLFNTLNEINDVQQDEGGDRESDQ